MERQSLLLRNLFRLRSAALNKTNFPSDPVLYFSTLLQYKKLKERGSRSLHLVTMTLHRYIETYFFFCLFAHTVSAG